MVSTSGIITTYAGQEGPCFCGSFSGDGGPATAASFSGPSDIALDSSGNLFIADTGNERIRKIATDGIVSTIAGDGQYSFSGDGGPSTSAELTGPNGLALDASGNLFITANNRVRRISPAGVITTVAGNGNAGFAGDGGPATEAEFDGPVGIALDAYGDLFIADARNNRIREVSASGIITTVAGNGTASVSGGGGPATEAEMLGPQGVAVDTAGELFISDTGAGRIREVSPNGIIKTIAGANLPGGGQPALSGPEGIALDASGNLYIADTFNFRVRKLTPAGVLTTIAGVGNGYTGGGYNGDGGPAASAELNFPTGVALDAAGNIYIADSLNARIRQVSTSGIITTVAGDWRPGYSGDGGPAASASLGRPNGVAVDVLGDILIGDGAENAIREVFSSNPPPAPSAPAAGVVDAAGYSATISAGGIGSIFGTNLAPTTASASFEPLPWFLGGSTVIINDTYAPLFFVSPSQINLQVPWELLSSQTATLTVTTPDGTSPPITVNLAPAAPGIFNFYTANSATQAVAVVAGTATWVAPVGAIPGVVSQPATAGDYLTMYCSGLGPVTNAPWDGAPPSGGSLSYLQSSVTVTIGGQPANVLFAGLAPGFVGLYQVNLEIPAGVAPGNAIPVIITAAGINSNAATIAVQ